MKEIVEINMSNYQNYCSLGIVAFSFAFSGAMGEGGGIYIIDREGRVYHANYYRGDNLLEPDYIKDIIPIFEECKFGLLGCISPEGWKSLYLGYGNHLLMIDELYDSFRKIVEDSNFTNSGDLFQHWPGLVLGLIGKDDYHLTMADIWNAIGL